MLGKQSLDGSWKLKGIDGHRGSPASYCEEEVDERTFVEAHVPGEVHLDLLRHGRIADPYVGTNALQARWVEEQYWIYRQRFVASAAACAAHRVWLVFEGLDLAAEVYLNGQCVGSHANAFRPCRIDVSGMLRPGENLLAVALDAGLHYAADRPAWEYGASYEHVLTKRIWLRKPQYQFAWDWNPRLINVGIYRPVRLEWTDEARLDQVTVYPELASDHQSALLHARFHVENVTTTPLKARLRLRLPEVPGATVEREVLLAPGLSSEALVVSVEHPKLWWPRPHGEQPLYQVVCELLVDGQVVDRAERRTGVRSIHINQSPHPVEGRYFTIEVNGVPIFAKGANWGPPDMIYASVDRARYKALIDLAVQANFNFFRVNGVGCYLDHDALELCDEAGIMVWHDLTFGCAKYPAGDGEFLDNVRAEITYVARELSPHPSLVLWCGNNEMEWGTWDWGLDKGRAFPDYAFYHYVFPKILAAEDPSRPYWPSSPYSPDHQPPNLATVGDQHPWQVSAAHDLWDFWAYRKDVSRFPDEGGALGASSAATLRQLLPPAEQSYLSPSWVYHDNELAVRPNSLMIERWFAEWLGLEPAGLSLDDYAFYSGILQAEALVEFVNNFRRRMFSTSSAVFWSYNDSWPVIHGWTIVDYYLRRKLAYHPVRRAFDTIQIIPVIEGDQVLIYGVNDALQAWRGEARFGLTRFDGRGNTEHRSQVLLRPNAATWLGSFPLADWQEQGYTQVAAYATLWQPGHAENAPVRPWRQNRLLLARYKDIAWPKPQISVSREGDQAVFQSDVFAWGVCLDPQGEAHLPDDLFDLLPGVAWSIPWPEDRALPTVARVANYDLA